MNVLVDDLVTRSSIMEFNKAKPRSVGITSGLLINPLNSLRQLGDQLMNILPESSNDYRFSCDCKTNIPSFVLPPWEFLKWHCPRLATRMFREFRRSNGFIPYENGFVYLIHAVGTNFYKIGKSIHPDKRILQISPKMPFESRLVKVWRSLFMSEAEQWMHREYEDHRANGEWFEFDEHWLANLLMNDRLENEIKYAYSHIWGKVIYGERSDLDKKELAVLVRYFGSGCLWESNFTSLNDVHCLDELSFMSIATVQHYFDEIERDAPLHSVPSALMQEAYRLWEEDDSICYPIFESERAVINKRWLEGSL